MTSQWLLCSHWAVPSTFLDDQRYLTQSLTISLKRYNTHGEEIVHLSHINNYICQKKFHKISVRVGKSLFKTKTKN